MDVAWDSGVPALKGGQGSRHTAYGQSASNMGWFKKALVAYRLGHPAQTDQERLVAQGCARAWFKHLLVVSSEFPVARANPDLPVRLLAGCS